MRFLHPTFITTLMLALVATPTFAQDVTPPDEYRAALVAYMESAIEGDGTVVTALALYQDMLDRVVAERERLEGITPDECYSDAHERYVEYAAFNIELMPDMLEQQARDLGASRDQLMLISFKVSTAYEWLRNEGYVSSLGGDVEASWEYVTPSAEDVDTSSLMQRRNLSLLRHAELEPSLRQAVLELFRLGRHGDAVMVAMREVETRVRAAGGFGPEDYGRDLMASAFAEEGPPADPDLPKGEQDGSAAPAAGRSGRRRG